METLLSTSSKDSLNFLVYSYFIKNKKNMCIYYKMNIIVNPKTKKKFQIFSKEGKNLLMKYLKYINGGSASTYNKKKRARCKKAKKQDSRCCSHKSIKNYSLIKNSKLCKDSNKQATKQATKQETKQEGTKQETKQAIQPSKGPFLIEFYIPKDGEDITSGAYVATAFNFEIPKKYKKLSKKRMNKAQIKKWNKQNPKYTLVSDSFSISSSEYDDDGSPLISDDDYVYPEDYDHNDETRPLDEDEQMDEYMDTQREMLSNLYQKNGLEAAWIYNNRTIAPVSIEYYWIKKPILPPSLPKFRDINGFYSIIYYDLKLDKYTKNKTRKRILFLGELHEFEYDDKAIHYINNLSKYISYNSSGSDCLDVYTEQGNKWTQIKNKDYLKGGMRSLTPAEEKAAKPSYSSFVNMVHNYYKDDGVRETQGKSKSGLRYHQGDMRTYRTDDSSKEFGFNYTDKSYYDFNEDDILALVFGIGPHAKNGIPNASLKPRWNATPSKGVRQYRLGWDTELTILRNRGRKSMLLFMKEYNIKMNKLYPILKNCVIMQSRGYKQKNYGWEATNDIYSFFRMFRTFTKKRKVPCVGGEQRNIIYSSHVGHALGIMYLIQEIFNIKSPNYYESVNNKIFKKMLKNMEKGERKDDYKPCPRSSPSVPIGSGYLKCRKPLGKSTTPLFFS